MYMDQPRFLLILPAKIVLYWPGQNIVFVSARIVVYRPAQSFAYGSDQNVVCELCGPVQVDCIIRFRLLYIDQFVD